MEKAGKMKKELHKNPFPTVDIIIKIKDEDGKPGFILIKRKNPPYGWALPGGFVEYGETLEEAAVREAKEETSLDIKLLAQFHTYSDPGRDPRFHTISTIFIAKAEGRPKAQDDAKEIGIFTIKTRPHPLAFDHEKILTDYFCTRKTRKHLRLCDSMWRRKPPSAPAPRGTSPVGSPRRRNRRVPPPLRGLQGGPLRTS